MYREKKSQTSALKTAATFILKNKGLTMFILTAFMSIALSQAVYAREVKVFFNGNEIRYAVPAQIYADYTMVPLSQTFEALVGAGTVYDPSTRTSTFRANGHVNVHTIGTNIVYVDGVPLQYPTPSVIIGDRALVPIRMITDTSGLNVDWDPVNYHVLITSPQPVTTPSPVMPVTINSVESSKTDINLGDSVILTVKTNSSASYVWISDGANNHAATYASMDSAGIKTWVLSYKPTTSVNLRVSANSTQDLATAVQHTLTLAVNTQKAEIVDVSFNKTTIAANEEIILTIRTNSLASYVRVDFDNQHAVATFVSADQAGYKTWSAKCYPSKTQNIVVSAGQTQNLTQAESEATKSININVDINLVAIQSVTANKTTINSGEPLVLTIKTNSAANYVWVESNGTQTSVIQKSIDILGVKTWEYTFNPTSSHQIRVLANSAQTSTGNGVAVTTQNITVVNTAVSIINATATPPTVNAGQSVNLSVQTNSATNYVWIEYQNTTLYLYLSPNDTSGNKTWTSSFTPTTTGNYTIHAGKTYGSKEATTNVYINVQGSQYPEIIDISVNPKETWSNQASTNNYFTIATNSHVTSVSAVHNGVTYQYTSSSPLNTGSINWYITVPVKGGGTIGSNETVTISAYNPTVGNVNRTVEIPVK